MRSVRERPRIAAAAALLVAVFATAAVVVALSVSDDYATLTDERSAAEQRAAQRASELRTLRRALARSRRGEQRARVQLGRS